MSLFQLADDVTELRAVTIAIHWLGDRGYLDICVWQTSSRGSLLMCALATGGCVMTAAAPKDFNKTRAAFMERVSAPNIPPHALKLAWLIAYRYMNRETRLAHPSQETLARDLGIEIRSVRRLLDILERMGLVIASGLGRGNASSYWIDPEKVTTESAFRGEKRTRKSGLQTLKKGDSRVRPTLIREPIRDRGSATHSPLSPEERDRASRESDSLDFGGRLEGAPKSGLEPIARPIEGKDPKRDAREEIAGEAVPEPESEAAEDQVARRGNLNSEIEPAAEIIATDLSELSEPIVPLDQARAFPELRALWDRGHLSDDTPKALAIARQAFAKACTIAEPAEILEAAKRWAAAADAPRFLPPLPQWLAAKGWEKPPLTKPAKASHERHSKRGQPRRNGKVNVADVFFGLADEFAGRTAS
jgi:hypothetical protein